MAAPPTSMLFWASPSALGLTATVNAATEIIAAQNKINRLIPGILFRTRRRGNAKLRRQLPITVQELIICYARRWPGLQIRSESQTQTAPASPSAPMTRAMDLKRISNPSPTASKLEGVCRADRIAGPNAAAAAGIGEATISANAGSRVPGYFFAHITATADCAAQIGTRMTSTQTI